MNNNSSDSVMDGIKNIVGMRKTLTHFLSIPVNNPDVITKFTEFTNQVNQLNKPDITVKHFQKTDKLHLTVGVLSLLTDEEKNSAIQALQESREIIDNARIRYNNPGDIRMKISGVKCMNDNSAKCKILYGIVDSEILQTIANEILGHFRSKGLIAEDRQEVKLHVTLMNLVFAKKATRKYPKPFDASDIVEKFSSYDFGDQKFEELHLSRFGTKGEGNYWQEDGVLKI